MTTRKTGSKAVLQGKQFVSSGLGDRWRTGDTTLQRHLPRVNPTPRPNRRSAFQRRYISVTLLDRPFDTGVELHDARRNLAGSAGFTTERCRRHPEFACLLSGLFSRLSRKTAQIGFTQ